MRFATLFLSILAIAPALTFAAPITPEHFEELEARWHNPFSLGGFKNFFHTVTNIYKKVAPVAKTLAPIAPIILKREDEMKEQLHRRGLPEAPTSPAFAPKAARNAYEKRDEYKHLEVRDWEEMPKERFYGEIEGWDPHRD